MATAENDRAGLTERRGFWVLPVAGAVVTQVQIDYAFGLDIDTVHVRIECPFAVEQAGETSVFDPNEWATLGPLVRLHQATIKSGSVRKDGILRLEFTDGTTITCEPHDQYEAFKVSGRLPPVQRRFELIALPGGGLASL
jgi:Family of unknown function (DUF6188)